MEALEHISAAAAPTIRVDRDMEGLQIAVRELFEESYVEELLKPTMDKLGGNVAAIARMRNEIPPRTLSPGYYQRASCLLDLSAAIEAGARYSAASLSRADVSGLHAVKRAKSEFDRDHPMCGACGTRQDNRYMRQCKSCKVKFAGRAD